MGVFAGPKKPEAPKPVQQVAPPVPSPVDEEVTAARDRTRSRAALASGRSSTILTGPQGLGGTSVQTAAKSLLGL